MEQLVLLVIIALISFINWAMQKSAERRKAKKLAEKSGPATPGQRPKPQPATDAETEMRRFMDALGLPTEAEPPVIQRQEQVEPAPQRQVTPPPIPKQQPQFQRGRVQKPEREMQELAARLQRAEIGGAEESVGLPGGRSGSYRELLKSPQSLRDAVVVREILGPPKALQDT